VVPRRQLLAEVTPWDIRAFATSLLLALSMVVLALLVTAVTDEGGVAWGERISRTLPVVPLCATVPVAWSVFGARPRSEARALAALGRSPAASATAAALGGASVGLAAGLVLLVLPSLSVHAFLPTAHTTGTFAFAARAFTYADGGWSVMRDGSIALAPPAASAAAGSPSALAEGATRWAASSVVLVGTLAFVATVVAARPGRRRRSGVLLLITGAASVLVLQAAALSRVPLWAAPVPASLLFIGAAWAIVRGAWHPNARARASTAHT
jgi:hypothetical protein